MSRRAARIVGTRYPRFRKPRCAKHNGTACVVRFRGEWLCSESQPVQNQGAFGFLEFVYGGERRKTIPFREVFPNRAERRRVPA